MYRLEDDQDTPSDIPKPDLSTTENKQATEISIETQEKSPHPDPANSLRHKSPFARPDLKGLFWKITTPNKTDVKHRGLVLAALTTACVAVFLTALDQTVVVTALPQITTDLQIPITQIDHTEWIISAYLLGFIVVMPLMGRVSDIYGRRRIFLLCLFIFGLGSILCGLAPVLGQNIDLSFLDGIVDISSPGLTFLVAARLIQAIGGGSIVPVSMAIAGDFYGKERRGIALGIIGAVTEAGGVLGPLYGAVIVEHIGWQYIFYFNVPLVIVLMVVGWFLIPRGKSRREGIDWIGTLLLGLALTCLSVGLAQQGTHLGPAPEGTEPQNNPVLLVLAVVFLIAFVIFELKTRWPVIDLTIFRQRQFAASALVSLLVGAALIIAMVDIPIYIDTVVRGPVIDSGWALLRMTVMIPFGALLGGWLCSRLSCRVTGVLGLIFTGCGFFMMSRWPVQVSWPQLTVSAMTTGLGFGLVISPISTTAINAVKATQAGVASSVITALRMIGMILMLAVLTSVGLAYFKTLVSKYPSLPVSATSDQFAEWSKGYAVALVEAAHTVYNSMFFTTMILCLLTIIPALFLWGRQTPMAHLLPEDEDDEAPAGAAALSIPAASPEQHAGADEKTQDVTIIPPAKKKRRRLLVAVSILLLVVLIGGGVFVMAALQPDDSTAQDTLPGDTSSTTGNSDGDASTATPTSGPRMFQFALDQAALTSIFVTQLHVQQGTLSDVSVVPLAHNGIILRLSLHIDANGIHRVLPIELDSQIGVDQQQNLHLEVLHLKRSGIDAGPTAAANMGTALNQLLAGTLMPALRAQLKGVKLLSAFTSSTIVCGHGEVRLVLLMQAPPIDGIAAQPTPTSLCFSGPVDLKNLMPH